MSKLHVKQIEGYISRNLSQLINMSDYDNHKDPAQAQKAFLSRGLAALAVSHLSGKSLSELAHFVTDGQDDGGIDLIFFDVNERSLYLVQSKWHEDGHGSIVLGDVLKFIAGVRKVLDNDIDSMNDCIKGRKTDIESALYDANARFVLVLAHTGQESLSTDVSSAVNSYVDSQNDTSELMSVNVLTQAELHRVVAAGVAGSPIAVEVQMSAWGQLRAPHFAIYGQVCATDVAAWMKAHGARLFDSNLRHFLGTSIVNQDIVATLMERPEDFWYFNNGITAIATEVAKKPLGGNSTETGIFECAGFSVVNGAQTVGSIHAADAQKPEAVAKAMVPVRIISNEQNGDTFSSDVTRFTNTQNAIEKRDFVALDPEQERIRLELHIESVEYAYKAGSGSGSSGARFDLTEATIAMACVNPDVSLAVQAKREIGKLWEDIGKAPYRQLFNSGLSGPALWETVQALREIETHLSTKAKGYSGRDNLICVHGNRFIQWAVLQSVQMKSGTAYSSVAAKIPAAVTDAVSQIIALVRSTYPDAYPASLFKNLAKCRMLASKLTVAL
jgi:hypothetical protein